MVNVKKFVTQKYLNAKNDGKDVNGKHVVIDAAFPETINGDEKLCLRFKGIEKPMVLNQTNISILSAALGDNTDDWISKKVSLSVVKVSFNGELKDSLQVNV